MKVQSHLPYCGGWVGYISYEANHKNFNIAQKKTTLFFLSSCKPETQRQVLTLLKKENLHPKSFSCSRFSSNESKQTYLKALEIIRQYLTAGDCYQINYTQCFTAEFHGDPLSAYLSLRRAVPSPFSAFLNWADESILSISPERFITINGNKAQTQPIKGTTTRGANSTEDTKLIQELKACEKNRAENLMIVDLMRNDFNKHCNPHSVKVPKLFEVQSFANVHHLVSTVTGEIPSGLNHVDFILSCFPGGSITGTPKKRAMEIIDELENQARGVYCGIIGYFSCNKNTTFNIAIRTLHIQNSKISAWAGGGIVLDSEPDQEYQESLNKIMSLLATLEKHSKP